MMGTIFRRLIDGATMFIVTAVSLCLLLYVSYGDSKRTYEQLHIEKLTANAAVVQRSIEKYLRDGLPLKQYAGFSSLAAPMLEGEDIDALSVYDQGGRLVFQVVDKKNPKLPPPPAAITSIKGDKQIEYGETHYQVVLPLRTRFETVGALVVSSPTRVVTSRVAAAFQPLAYWAVGLSAAFALLLLFVLPAFVKSRIPWLQIAYGLTFLAMSAAVISTLFTLYYDGVQGKSKATATTFSQRLSDIVAFKLDFADIEGLGRAFQEYRSVNTEVNEAALVENGAVRVATDPDKFGKAWTAEADNFEYRIRLSAADPQRRIDLAVTVPRDIVFERVMRSVKNFAALFVACAFLAGLFLQVAASLQNLRSRRAEAAASGAADDAGLIIVKPIFFLAVFLDALTYSFLPAYMQAAAADAGMAASYASAPFTAYYLCFALSLLPAGSLAERYGAKPLIVLGMLLAGAGVGAMYLELGLVELTALRGLVGIGQGMLLIGVQTYILAVASPEKRTQGAAIIVFGFQGGMISGMALGSLLVNYLHAPGVFALGGAVGLLTITYTLLRLPHARQKEAAKGFGEAVGQLGTDIGKVITNLDFLRTLICVGIPAKAILTGIITFAMPLLLGQYGYRPEDIGQIIMLYGLGVIAASSFASRLVDRTKNAGAVLFWGAALSAIGLILIGAMGSPFVAEAGASLVAALNASLSGTLGASLLGPGLLGTLAVVLGTLLVGIAHGFINAPVVTHVGQSELAGRIGVNPVTTSYRFLERAGHVAGPFIIAQLFLFWGQHAHIIAAVGVVIGVLGVLFVLHAPRSRVRTPVPEATP